MADVSEPIVGLAEAGSVEVVVDEELVLWSASMEPVELVPVAVSASGADVVASGRAVSVCDVGEDGYELLGSPAIAAVLNRTEEITTASAFLRIRLPSLVWNLCDPEPRGAFATEVSVFGDIRSKAVFSRAGANFDSIEGKNLLNKAR